MPVLNMAWLKEYTLPLCVTLLMHAILLVWLAADFSTLPDKPLVKRPKAITASLIQLKEKKAPAKKVQKQKKPVKKKANNDEAKKKAALAAKKKQREIAKAKADKAKKIKAAKLKQQKAEAAELKKQAELKKKAESEALKKKKALAEAAAQREREDAFMSDFVEDELLEDSSADEATAMSYMGVIQSAIASNWSRPPSARNGMQVTLSIQLVPTGAIVNVNVAESSGNDAFDRSAVAAVDKTERFPELAELESHIFEKYYRRFSLVFKPEDLRL